MKARNRARQTLASQLEAEGEVTREGPVSRVRRRRARAHRSEDIAFVGAEGFDWDDAESFAEEFIASATGAEAVAESARDEFVMEEVGGPFLDVRTDQEEAMVRSIRWFGEDER